MAQNNQNTFSIWKDYNAEFALPILKEEAVTSICVIGGGISGLTTAYLLQKEGQNVILVEAENIMAGETGNTTAHLASALDSRFFNLIKIHGKKFTKLAMESHIEAINLIEKIVLEEKIECDFQRVDGYLYATDALQEKYLQEELEAALKIGFPGVQKVNNNSYFPKFKGILFPNQAKFNITKYIFGLVKSFLKMGGKVYIKSPVINIKTDKTIINISTAHGKITAEKLIIATGTPIYGGMSLHLKQAAYRTYALGFTVTKDSLKDLIWDLASPYNYVRTVKDNADEILIVGGKDHKVGQANDMKERWKELETWTRNNFKDIGEKKYEWSGQIWEPGDGIAFIGRATNNEKNVFLITGTSGNGMTNGTVGGMIIKDLIMKRKNIWEKVYNPKRFRIKAIWSMLKEDTNACFYMLKEWMKPSEIFSSLIEKGGEGKIIWENGSKVAIYKDESGKIYKCSAICTHQKAILKWNAGEKSWDCPVHGSRFNIHGKPLCGPAKNSLKKH